MADMREIRIEKIVVNIGVGEAGEKLVKAQKVLDLVTKRKSVQTLSRRAVQSLVDVDRSYVAFFRQILEKGNRQGQFAVKDPNLIAISVLFLCAVWALKRWNLKGYALPEVIEHMENLIMNGIASR